MKYKNYKLEELATIKYGKNQKKVISDNGHIPIYGTGGLMGYATEALYDKPSVLIGRKGTIEKVRYVTHPFWTVDTLFYTIIQDNIVLPHYLYYLMSLLDLKKFNEGTTIPSLRTETLNRIEFNVPELEYQSKVLSILEPIEEKIDTNNLINKNLDEQARLLFRYWFIDAPESNSWKKGTFSNIIDLMIPGDWGKDTPSGKNTEMVYCIRGADIPEVKAGNKGKMPTRYILPQNYVNKHLIDGDVVVEISGGSPTQSTGRIAAVSQSLLNRYDKGMVCTNFCKALKPRPGYSMFLYYYWQYLYDKNVFFSYENGTTGIKNLDISGFIETEPIVLPPQNLVSKFDSFCQSLFNIIFANGRENEGLAMLRDNLLPQLMTGKLEISGLDL